MREAILYEKQENGRVKCHVCPRLCLIAPDHLGVCLSRKNINGKLYTLLDDFASSVAVDPIEKKPLFHFFPGSNVFSIGTLGCNFRCKHCQNWQIAHASPDEAIGQASSDKIVGCNSLPPNNALEICKKNKCQGVAWTYNEPTIWLEYTLKSAKLFKEENLYTVYVTNGYITPEALGKIAPLLDAYRVDVKGFTNEFYRKLTGISDFQSILDAAIKAKNNWDCHVEIVTNVIPTMNDDEAQLRNIAKWIYSNLGPKTPWHVTRFFPYLKLSHLPPTPIETIEIARQIGFEEGLHFVYTGNIPGHIGQNTICPKCKETVIKRAGYQIEKNISSSGNCGVCDFDLNIRMTLKTN